jgi:hypothetical protein
MSDASITNAATTMIITMRLFLFLYARAVAVKVRMIISYHN